MTKVNLLLPLFEVNLITNNPQIIKSTLHARYPGLPIDNIYWLDSSSKQKNNEYECVVRIANLNTNFDQVADTMVRVNTLESTLGRIKTDLFNLIKQYECSLGDKKNWGNIDRFKDEPKMIEEDASVSLKIDQKQKRSPREEGSDSDKHEQELMNAISELTRENLRLKDMLSYSQAHIEFLIRSGEQKSLEKKEGDK